MKFKKLCTYIAGLLTACLPLASALAADLPAVDDPEVMDRVVAQRMLPISMTAPVDTGTLLLSDSPEAVLRQGIIVFPRAEHRLRKVFMMNRVRKVLRFKAHAVSRGVGSPLLANS